MGTSQLTPFGASRQFPILIHFVRTGGPAFSAVCVEHPARRKKQKIEVNKNSESRFMACPPYNFIHLQIIISVKFQRNNLLKEKFVLCVKKSLQRI
jgi:hypothetical protein